MLQNRYDLTVAQILSVPPESWRWTIQVRASIMWKSTRAQRAAPGCTIHPHGSHMGGAWERMIGIACHILDCMLLEHKKKSHLTHKVMITPMPEVAAVLNARPLILVSSDPESPLILIPAMLLTFKTGSTTSSPLSQNFEEPGLFKE